MILYFINNQCKIYVATLIGFIEKSLKTERYD